MANESTFDSPQSLPSVAETSTASSCDGEEVSRVLFYHEDEGVSNTVVENMAKISEDQAKRTKLCGSEVSITSSETTAVAAWNLSGGEAPSRTGSLLEPSGDRKVHDTADDEPATEHKFEATTQPRPMPTVVEEPPEDSTSCNSAMSLTPRQMAEIFLAFEGARSIWPMAKGSEETLGATGIAAAMKQQEEDARQEELSKHHESLDRECMALKKIIEEDSSKIFNLKRAMEAQRELNALKEIEIEDKQAELQVAEDRIQALKKERELLRERQEEMSETIQILKVEIDKLSTYKCRHEAFAARNFETDSLLDDEEELEELRMDVQLFSAQVVEMAKVVATLRTTVETKDQEIEDYKSQVLKLEADKACADQNVEMPLDLTTPESSQLASVLQGISTRLETVEKEKRQSENQFLEALKAKENEIEEIRDMLKVDSEKKAEDLKISQDPDEIEVVLPKGEHRNKHQTEQPAELMCCCESTGCDAWSAISGDLP